MILLLLVLLLISLLLVILLLLVLILLILLLPIVLLLVILLLIVLEFLDQHLRQFDIGTCVAFVRIGLQSTAIVRNGSLQPFDRGWFVLFCQRDGFRVIAIRQVEACLGFESSVLGCGRLREQLTNRAFATRRIRPPAGMSWPMRFAVANRASARRRKTAATATTAATRASSHNHCKFATFPT